MTKIIKPFGEIHIAISDILNEYTSEVREFMAEEAEKASKIALEQIKEKAPKSRPKYSRSFKVHTEKTAFMVTKKIKASKKMAPLTHILENDHVKRNGTGVVKGTPHLKPAQDKANEVFKKGIERRLSK